MEVHFDSGNDDEDVGVIPFSSSWSPRGRTSNDPPLKINLKPKRAVRIKRIFLSLDKKALHSQNVNERELSKKESDFEKLPNEIILRIFHKVSRSTLVNCSKVCKKWRLLSYDSSLWKVVNLPNRKLSPSAIKTLIKRGVNALNLFMCQVKGPIRLLTPNPLGMFWKLQYLNLSLACVSEADLVAILSLCGRLKNISLEGCSMTDDACSQLSANHDLEVLNMSLCSGLSATGLTEICLRCTKLKSWNLAWTHLQEDSYDVLANTIPVTIERLNISGCRYRFYDRNLLAMISRCPNVIELDISDCVCLTGHSLVAIVNKLPLLEHLSVSRCSVNPYAYLVLKNLKHLKTLSIFRSMKSEALTEVQKILAPVQVNVQKFSTIARPTFGIRMTSIWGIRA